MALLISPTIVEHFDVSGATLREAVDTMPEEGTGDCTWEGSYEYDSVDAKGRPRGLRVYFRIRIRVPRWSGRDGATPAEQREWDRFHEAAMKHERGHESRVRNAAGQLHRRLLETLARDLETVFRGELDRIQRENDAYDKATDHGRHPAPGTVITIP